MLTAQRENSPVETEPLPPRSRTSQSFDRVVNSIAGLRERVQGFTVEQLSDIDQQLQMMAQQLRELQRTLRVLAEIKERISRLEKPVQQAAAESLEQGQLVMQFEPVAAQAIAQVGSLLKFRRLINLLKAAKSSSGETAPAVADTKTPMVSKPVELIPESPNELAADLPIIRPEPPEKSTNDDNVVVANEPLNRMEPVFDPAPAEMDFDRHEIFPEEPAGAIFLNDDIATIHPQEIIAEFADTRQESPPSRVAAVIDTVDEAIFEEFKGSGNMEANLAIPNTDAVDTRFQTRTAASADADFDQRLLDDLIKDYGEFTILPNTTPKAETKKDPKSGPPPVTPRVETSVTTNPPTQPNLPSPRKDGELDLKLKKLIKDYGEYDLYSRQTPLKLKTGVIAAFLVLTLLFSGFYFFSSSKSAVPASASSTSRSQSSPVAAPKETVANGETNSSETLQVPSISTVDVPKSAEANASQNVANKPTTKKTK